MDAPEPLADPGCAPVPAPAADARPALVIDTQVVMDWLVFHDARVKPLTAAITSGVRALARGAGNAR